GRLNRRATWQHRRGRELPGSAGEEELRGSAGEEESYLAAQARKKSYLAAQGTVEPVPEHGGNASESPSDCSIVHAYEFFQTMKLKLKVEIIDTIVGGVFRLFFEIPAKKLGLHHAFYTIGDQLWMGCDWLVDLAWSLFVYTVAVFIWQHLYMLRIRLLIVLGAALLPALLQYGGDGGGQGGGEGGAGEEVVGAAMGWRWPCICFGGSGAGVGAVSGEVERGGGCGGEEERVGVLGVERWRWRRWRCLCPPRSRAAMYSFLEQLWAPFAVLRDVLGFTPKQLRPVWFEPLSGFRRRARKEGSHYIVKTISRDGGVLELDGVLLVIPPLALSAETEIRMSVFLPEHDEAKILELAGPCGSIIQLEPHNLTFERSAKLHFPTSDFAREQAAGIGVLVREPHDPDTDMVGTWRVAYPAHAVFMSEIDSVCFASVEIDHFSNYVRSMYIARHFSYDIDPDTDKISWELRAYGCNSAQARGENQMFQNGLDRLYEKASEDLLG
ncbi:hypothetical protein CYMTET_9276, partial [Cymbomonas tetramitiformis]